MPGLRGWLLSGVSLLLTALVFYLLSFYVNFNQVFQMIKKSDPLWLLVLIVIALLYTFIAVPLKWLLVIRLSKNKTPFAPIFKVFSISVAVNTLLPMIGLLRIALLSKELSMRFTELFSSYLFNKFINIFTYVACALIAIALYKPQAPSAIPLLFLAGSFLFFSERFLSLLSRLIPPQKFPRLSEQYLLLLSSFKGVSNSSKAAITIIIGAINFTTAMAFYLCLRAIGLAPSLFETSMVASISVFIGNLPVTISGLGAREIAFVSLFKDSFGAESALSAALLYTFAFYGLPAIITAPFAWKFWRDIASLTEKEKKPSEDEAQSKRGNEQ